MYRQGRGILTVIQWQTYTYNGPLTPELEQAFKKEASRALSRSSGTPLGFSVSTSVTTVNGVTRGSTEFQVGKGTAWTSEERRNLDEKFGRLAPDGRMIGYVAICKEMNGADTWG
ncbi:hypothetical protein I350_00171 [Cryptococcus amylolentus CBS 6273]|uniref:Uncharacterized protein n=1 Tax=Cryptococcus amylolentus CBS 6273 TaxID=1296118 RepID=A0A1E3KGG8_9TREE|nr:hypothetical protein I350_00171 [Cryptococcus amylolentus CBS 6273]